MKEKHIKKKNSPKASKSAVQGSATSSAGATTGISELASPLERPFNRAALNLSHTEAVQAMVTAERRNEWRKEEGERGRLKKDTHSVDVGTHRETEEVRSWDERESNGVEHEKGIGDEM